MKCGINHTRSWCENIFLGGVVAFLVLLSTSVAFPHDLPGLVPTDEKEITSVGDPQISPDGSLVAFVVNAPEGSNIWLASVNEKGELRQFTTAASSRSPRWSADGRSIAFLSARTDPAKGKAGESQVYMISLNGGEARRLTNLKNGVSSFQLSPDGSRLACVSQIGAEDAPDYKAPTAETLHYTKLFYKRDGPEGFIKGPSRRRHIWIVDVKSGADRQITFGDDRNDADPQWSPDNSRIAFASTNPDVGIGSNKIWVVGVDGSSLTLLAGDLPNQYNNSQPRWSLDGQRIAYVGGAPGLEDNVNTIWVVPSSGGEPTVVSSEVADSDPDGPRWLQHDRALTFSGAHKGEVNLFRLDMASGHVTQVTRGGRYVGGSNINEQHDIMAYNAQDPTHPTELYIFDLSSHKERQLTHFNQTFLSRHALQSVDRFSIPTADGDVDAFFMKPLNWEEGKKYPMVLSIHGGPSDMYGLDFSVGFQSLVTHGWAVLFTNPRGSTGYGEKFQRAVNKEWGGKPYQDLMNAVDEALKRFPWIDSERLGVTGYSYGGYMTNWIVSQNTRFKAAVACDGMSDFIVNDAIRDVPYGHKGDFGGDVYENPELYWKYSPIRNASHVKTPTLIVHGLEDYRVNFEQAEEFYRALGHYGVPSELVVFPHGTHRSSNSTEAAEWVTYWFNKYLNGNNSAVHPPSVGNQ